MLDNKEIAALVTPVVLASNRSMGLMEIAWKSHVPTDQIDAIREQPRQHREALRHLERRIMRQHHAAGAQPDMFRRHAQR